MHYFFVFCTKFYYFCGMNHAILNISSVPIRSAIVSSLYPEINGKNAKVAGLVQKGELIRLKKGMFVVSPELSGTPLSLELIANHLYTPSYVSMLSALRYYGLIPEAVYTIQSMTTKHSRSFENSLGTFTYTTINNKAFSIGLRRIQRDASVAFIMASPEKALCDLIANSPNVNLRYLREAEIFLAEDIRLDMDEFAKMNPDIFEAYIAVGKKASSIKTILKLLKR